MKFKRVIAFLLAAQMLLMTACSDATVSTDDTGSAAGETSANAGETAAAETEEMSDLQKRAAIPDNLPAKTFDGKAFRVMTTESKEYQFRVEELTGESTNDAIHDRNLRIEDRFDVNIETVIDATPYSSIDALVLSGTSTVELVDHYEYKAHVPISRGNYLDWNTIPMIDQNQPWWNKVSNDGSTINGKLYCIIGDLSLTGMRFTYAMFYNMDLMQNYGYSSDTLYGYVKEGVWTIDKLTEVASSVHADANGDGEANGGDTFGYAYWNYHGTDVWVTAIGERVTSMEGNELVITLGTEKVFSTLEKLNTLVYETPGAHKFTDENEGRSEFISGHIGIQPLMFDDCYTHLRDVEFAYGVLPYPKYDEEQPGYYTNSMDQHSVFGTPKTLPADDYEFVGIMMEVLNAETYKTVYPEFYDAALKGKYSEDTATAEMIDLIMDGRVFEFSFQFGEYLSSLPYMFRNSLYNNDTNLSSSLKKVQKSLKKKLQEMYSFYADEAAE